MTASNHSSSRHRSTARAPRWIRLVGVIGLVLVFVILGSGAALTVVANNFAEGDRIARNVYIEDLPVAGMTTSEAVAALESRWVPRLPTVIRLTHPGGKLEMPTDELGAAVQLDMAAAEAYRVGRAGSLIDRLRTQVQLGREPALVTVPCTVDEAALDAALADITEKVNREPRDAKAEVSDDDEVSVTAEVVGVAVDVAQSKAALLEALTARQAGDVALVVTERKPAVTRQDLAYLETVLASYTTRFNSGEVNRTHNLTLGAQKLDRAVIMPGDTFSLNDIVGERLPGRGFRKAPIFIEGGTLTDDYGGGVCQVASTVYNTALLANMTIVARNHHVRPVKYVPLGRDAMVAYGSSDLKWRNAFSHPVLLLARVSGERLTVKIIGKRSDKVEVRIERSGVASIGHGKKEFPDPTLEEGKKVVDKPGWDGGRATVRRQAKDGEEWRTNLSYSDSYASRDDVVKVGTKKKTPAKPGATVPTVPGGEQPSDDDEAVAPPPAERSRPAAKPPTRPAPPRSQPRSPSVPGHG